MNPIRIGTRGSPLALKQSHMVAAEIARAAPETRTEIVVIKTSGDWAPEQGETRLSSEKGGKGQFAKEIQTALLADEIDCAVHSMKDMETKSPAGLSIACMLPREDIRDALLLSDALKSKPAQSSLKDFDVLPRGATVGTASVRRQAFLLSLRPDVTVIPLRGNVETRIQKVRTGQVDATFLALAGLKRLGLEAQADVVLDPELFLPAAAQGAIGIEIKSNNNKILAILSQFNSRDTFLCVSAERAALEVLDGSCHTPIGAWASLQDERMTLRLCVARIDGSAIFKEQSTQVIQDIDKAIQFGQNLAQKLKDILPKNMLTQKAD